MYTRDNITKHSYKVVCRTEESRSPSFSKTLQVAIELSSRRVNLVAWTGRCAEGTRQCARRRGPYPETDACHVAPPARAQADHDAGSEWVAAKTKTKTKRPPLPKPIDFHQIKNQTPPLLQLQGSSQPVQSPSRPGGSGSHARGGSDRNLAGAAALPFGVREMWRLRIAEGGGDPWLRTKNGHVGRQVWEFDAAAEPDPDVEAARRRFTERRHELKHSADLLMRLQVTTISPGTCSPSPSCSVLRSPPAAAGARMSPSQSIRCVAGPLYFGAPEFSSGQD